jgi:hypothetical protein
VRPINQLELTVRSSGPDQAQRDTVHVAQSLCGEPCPKEFRNPCPRHFPLYAPNLSARRMSRALPSGLRAHAEGDDESFNGLCDALSKANLHTVARTVRDERADLIIPSHPLYTQQHLLNRRNELRSPIYVTPKGAHGARRCTVGGNLNDRPVSQTPPPTPSAMYSSPYLLKQFAASAVEDARPRTATATANANAWRAPLDSQTNRSLYERHRAAGHGWTASMASPAPEPVDILDVDAERELREQEQAPAEVEPVSPAGPELEAVAQDEATPPHQFPIPMPAYTYFPDNAAPKAAGPNARRTLLMNDAAQFYESNCAVPPPPSRATHKIAPLDRSRLTESRARRLEANRSDIFGFAVEGRGHWSVGPRLAERDITAARQGSGK